MLWIFAGSLAVVAIMFAFAYAWDAWDEHDHEQDESWP